MKKLLPLLSLLTVFILQAEDLTAKIDVTFDGTSTLHDFTGTAQSEAPATWIPGDKGATLTIPEVIFEVSTLSTDHKKRDKNMLKMFEPATHPLVKGKISDWKLSAKEATEQILVMEIHGQTLEVPVTVSAYTQTEEGIALSCLFTLSLKAFDLKRPSVLGVIRVGDKVNLQVNLLLVQP